MKASKYNYIVPFGEKKIFFNGITEAFFLVTPEYEGSYRKIIEFPDDNNDWAESFVVRMKDSGFIIDDDTDELDLIKAKFDRLPIKKLGKASAYDRTLDNINLIARHTLISLRFNYTKENLKPDKIFETLREKLDPEVTGRISFTIFKVWQQNQNEINREDVDDLFRKGIETGMYSTLCYTGICYADWYNFDCVFPNGHVGKCDNHSPEKGPGILQTDGTISWMEDMSDYYAPHIFDDRQAICTECKHLPICWGPCISKRESMLRDNGTIECKYKYPDRDMNIRISDFCKTKLQWTN